MGCRYLASHTEERARACQLDEARCRGVEAEQLLADVLLVGQFGDVDDLVSPAIVASCGQGALDNDVVFCQLAKVVVRERADALRRGEFLVSTDRRSGKGPYHTRTSWRHPQARPSSKTEVVL